MAACMQVRGLHDSSSSSSSRQAGRQAGRQANKRGACSSDRQPLYTIQQLMSHV